MKNTFLRPKNVTNRILHFNVSIRKTCVCLGVSPFPWAELSSPASLGRGSKDGHWPRTGDRARARALASGAHPDPACVRDAPRRAVTVVASDAPKYIVRTFRPCPARSSLLFVAFVSFIIILTRSHFVHDPGKPAGEKKSSPTAGAPGQKGTRPKVEGTRNEV